MQAINFITKRFYGLSSAVFFSWSEDQGMKMTGVGNEIKLDTYRCPTNALKLKHIISFDEKLTHRTI